MTHRSVAVPGHSNARREKIARTSEAIRIAMIAAPEDERTPQASHFLIPARDLSELHF